MSVFDWCVRGDHASCHRSYQPVYWEPSKKTYVNNGPVRKCECRKRGCKCYVPPAERTKTKKTRRRKK